MEVLHQRCAGLDVHKKTVVAAVRLATENRLVSEVKTFATTTAGLLGLSDWLAENGCTPSELARVFFPHYTLRKNYIISTSSHGSGS